MIKCIIVDDEPLAQQVLERHVLQTEQLQPVKICSTALEAFDTISQEKIDLMFLDIKMPSLSGMDFIKTLKSPPAVIFTTAYLEYAAESYELEAVDYLVKPVTFERFTKSMSKFLKQHGQPLTSPDYSYFKVNGKLIKLAHAEIIYAQSVKDYLVVRTINDQLITYMTMKYLNDLLPHNLFWRVHRSFIVNSSYIKSISGSEIEVGNTTVPIGKIYKPEIDSFKKKLNERREI